MRSTPLNQWYVVHEANQSILYYGFYRSFNDGDQAKENQRAQADRAAIDQLTDQRGDRPFQHCFFVALSSPDPVAPSEWDLRNARGYWTLQIAAYLDDPRRKEAAVEAVRGFREAGIEAYFYHGETISSVCIGVWPEEAVRKQETDVGGSTDPSQPILVSNVPLPREMVQGLRDESNQKVRVLQPKMDIADPTLRAAIAQYPEHAVNGYVQQISVRDPQTGQLRQRGEPSMLFAIPQSPPSILTNPTAVHPSADALGQGDAGQPRPMIPAAESRPGSKLRSVGN
jgi:hypothetical protein